MSLKDSLSKNLSILKAAFSKQTKEPVINTGFKNDNSKIYQSENFNIRSP